MQIIRYRSTKSMFQNYNSMQNVQNLIISKNIIYKIELSGLLNGCKNFNFLI